MELARYYEAGGWGMYPITLIATLAAPASLVLPIIGFATRTPRLSRILAFCLLALAALALAAGVIGWQSGLHAMESAVMHVNPADQEVVRMAGSSEARVCLIFGLWVTAFPAAAAASLAGIATSRAKASWPRVLVGCVAGLALFGAVAAIAIHENTVRAGEEAAAKSLRRAWDSPSAR